ncbi:zinc-binding alcohol dehydrogenase family protein [Streptosporangium sp. NPDC023963]|uniref:zinc-binding alcohol dehydrogenase family protein n=1 Tax=Streptosporangium sp. NPDC023963 TaxID=3155608 RepID=UPI003431044B
MTRTMTAWVVRRPGPMATHPLERVRLPVPEPAAGEVLVRVEVCAVCRTDLHLAEGDLLPRRPGTVPGHEVVGRVADRGPGADRFCVGARVGVAWLRSTCGECRYCARGAENLCPYSRYTGWDADGGYAEYLTVPQGFAYPLPEDQPAEELAPLLCAGIIGYRALLRAELPPGGRLGVYGFGASAHLTAQVALARGATVHVLTRSASARGLALELGVASAGGAYDVPPEPLDAAILFAPVGDLVPVALAALDRGGTLAVAGIHLSDIPPLNYCDHLFQERTLRSVTANTRADGRALLEHTARHPPRVTTTAYDFERADQALADLAADRVTGAAILRIGDSSPAADRGVRPVG